MPDRGLLEKIVSERAYQLQVEIKGPYPEATVESFIDAEGRGIIIASFDSFIISKEFIETEDTISDPTRFSEYLRVMTNKARLVVIVPRRIGLKVRLRMLDFNQMWLFYYQVYDYDSSGNLRLIDRTVMKKMIIQSGAPSCPEVA